MDNITFNNIEFEFDSISFIKTIPFTFNGKEGVVVISQISVGGIPTETIEIESEHKFTEEEENIIIKALENKL
jgi:hypothetical protein